MHRLPSAIALVFLVLSCALAAEDKDLISLKAGGERKCMIDTETPTELKYRMAPNSKPADEKYGTVVRWEYVEMRSGNWPKAVEARDRGRYEDAADLFEQMAVTGSKEWQKVYGYFYSGDSFELAGRYEDAAAAFAKVAEGFPKHRLWVDAKYRCGFALALGKKKDEALKIADELQAYAKANTWPAANVRNYAIRAAVAFVAGDVAKLTEYKNQATFKTTDPLEFESWFHFGIFYAESLRKLAKPNDAKIEFTRMMNALDNDPAKRARVGLGYGLCLIETDKQGALAELIKLDALPYGSPDQKCEARYNAGKIMLDEAKTMAASAETMKDEKKAAFQKSLDKTARLMLTAAAGSIGTSPSKSLAKELLDKIGPDPAEKAEQEAKDKAEKEAKAKPAAADKEKDPEE